MSSPPKLTLLLCAVVCALLSCRPPAPTASTPRTGIDAISPSDDTATKMRRFAEQAVIDGARHYHVQLDYAPPSVETVERILDSLTKSPNFSRYTDKDLRAEALIFGAYIGEVIRRERGGQWAEDRLQIGPGTYPLTWPGGESFPYAWCYKRLTNGPEDNVWHKYQILVIQKPKS